MLIAVSTAAVLLGSQAAIASAHSGQSPARSSASTSRSSASMALTPALHRLRVVTAKYHSVATARQNGYQRFTDVNGIACIAQPGVGGMGVHYVNSALVGNPAILRNRPEAMVYAVRDGRKTLAAVEYLVVKDAWDATHADPPMLFGHMFMTTDAPNRFGLPAFYSLHVWVWKHNPAGMFEMWNPDVHCPAAS